MTWNMYVSYRVAAAATEKIIMTFRPEPVDGGNGSGEKEK